LIIDKENQIKDKLFGRDSKKYSMATVATLEQALIQQITRGKLNFVHTEILFAFLVNTQKAI